MLAILTVTNEVVLEVKECNAAGGYVMCKVLNNAMIGERKNMNLPGVKVELPVLGETDKHDILNFEQFRRVQVRSRLAAHTIHQRRGSTKWHPQVQYVPSWILQNILWR